MFGCQWSPTVFPDTGVKWTLKMKKVGSVTAVCGHRVVYLCFYLCSWPGQPSLGAFVYGADFNLFMMFFDCKYFFVSFTVLLYWLHSLCCTTWWRGCLWAVYTCFWWSEWVDKPMALIMSSGCNASSPPLSMLHIREIRWSFTSNQQGSRLMWAQPKSSNFPNPDQAFQLIIYSSCTWQPKLFGPKLTSSYQLQTPQRMSTLSKTVPGLTYLYSGVSCGINNVVNNVLIMDWVVKHISIIVSAQRNDFFKILNICM